ncbi:MAG: hypothetical protein WCK46_01035 [Candidatus Adlerbacteria bacterium]
MIAQIQAFLSQNLPWVIVGLLALIIVGMVLHFVFGIFFKILKAICKAVVWGLKFVFNLIRAFLRLVGKLLKFLWRLVGKLLKFLWRLVWGRTKWGFKKNPFLAAGAILYGLLAFNMLVLPQYDYDGIRPVLSELLWSLLVLDITLFGGWIMIWLRHKMTTKKTKKKK